MASVSIGKLQIDSSQVSSLGAPVLILIVLAMMILPLPALVLDLLFTFNIALALMVLLVSLYTRKPLDFSAFPTVLLVTTLLRLSLNVASTRVVLMNGHTGPDAAGKVIEAFGHFLVGGNFAVGLVVFVILVVINFVVVTKGAGRIAEVAARFTLDAMPGKQMAIDADLNAGLIEEKEAKRRRAEVTQEAEFYGSMDGASKFVRGDAVAGILILVINILGGLAVGVLQHDLAMSQAANNYVLLAIGDGLVAQIPALIISVAAGFVVSRVGDGNDIGGQVSQQILGSPQALTLTAGVLALLGLIPGMPHMAFLLLAAGTGAVGWYVGQVRPRRAAAEAASAAAASSDASPRPASEASWDDVAPVDVLGLEVGYRLIPLVDRSQDGDLLKRIKAIRKKFAADVGFLPPPVHIRDNLELRPNQYRVTLKGVVIAEAEVFNGMYLAINPGRVTGTIHGTATVDPAFGLPAIWIDAGAREQAASMGYTVVDAGSVVATHVSQLLQTHSGELLGRMEVQQLLDLCGRSVPKLVEDVVPKLVPIPVLQRVLQNLLDEGVHIRDMRTIMETLAETAPIGNDADVLTTEVRNRLGRAIVQGIAGVTGELSVMVFEPDLERLLAQAVAAAGPSGDGLGLEPGLAETVLNQTVEGAGRQEQSGQVPVLLVPDRLRLPLARLFRRSVPRMRVLSHGEIPESRTIRVSSMIGRQ